MHKFNLRPLRLIRINTDQMQNYRSMLEMEETQHVDATRPASNGLIQEMIPITPTGGTDPLLSGVLDTNTKENKAADSLLKRTPHSYLFNQLYGLWFFASLFFLTLIITRQISQDEYGVYAIALSAFNTVAYIVAFGLEDAITTYVPRLFAEHGQASAAQLIRRLLALRIAILVCTCSIMLLGLPALANLIALTHLNGSSNLAAQLRDPKLLSHITPIAFYVLGNGISSLFTSVCAALMRMRLVLVVGSLTQLGLLLLGWFVLQMHWGVNGLLWSFALTSLFQSAALALWQSRLLFARHATYRQSLTPVLRLSISAWLTNLANGALLKQTSIILLGVFAISVVEIGYFNLSFQLAHSANLLLVTGFGGVSGSALSAAFVGENYDRLSRSWQALIKIETLLAAPLLVFCLFNASNLAHMLYGSAYDPVGPLLAIFLFFNVIVRILGTTIHQFALYVIGKSSLVVLSQWVGLLSVLLFGILLIPGFGPAGALIADGIAQVITGGVMLAVLWRKMPHKYPTAFTLRILLAVTIAALPSILWHPADRLLLGVSGMLFLFLCLGLLLLIKPLKNEDMQMLTLLQPRIANYLKGFARK